MLDRKLKTGSKHILYSEASFFRRGVLDDYGQEIGLKSRFTNSDTLGAILNSSTQVFSELQ